MINQDLFYGVPANYIVGVVCLCSGLFSCIFGYKYRNLLLACFGSGVGTVLSYYLVTYFTLSMVANLLISFFISFILCFMSLHFKRFGVGIISILTAGSIVRLITPSISNSIISQVFIYLCFCLIPSIYINFPDLSLLITSTFFGSWFLTFGIDSFLGSGFPNPYNVANGTWVTEIDNSDVAFVLSLFMASISISSLMVQVFLVNNLTSDVDKMVMEEIAKEYNIDINEFYAITKGGDEDENETPFIDPTLYTSINIDQSDYKKDKLSQFSEESKPFLNK